MTKIEKLIEKYQEELQTILNMFYVTDISDIHELSYKWRAGVIQNFINELEDL